ncbi:hypothetical protein DFJ77DRAFT_472174 [Powellomyces hirtus]|nr:hypothetical protein DFJ77DRAFT_472174 [Powellomyces hirtus]
MRNSIAILVTIALALTQAVSGTPVPKDDDDSDNRARNLPQAQNCQRNLVARLGCVKDSWSAQNGGCFETECGDFISGAECAACTGLPILDD